MIRLVEIVLGVALIYGGLEKFSGADQIRGVVYGFVAIVGLVMIVHGLLLYSVPDFFEPSLAPF